MTIDQLITFLTSQRETLGGDAPVTIMWGCAITDFKYYTVQNGVLIFDAESYGDSEHNEKFEYMKNDDSIPTVPK